MLLQHWLSPGLSLEAFFAQVWERRPLLVQRNSPGFYGGLLSANAIRRQLQRGLQYALELDVVQYNGVVRMSSHPARLSLRMRSDALHQLFLHSSHATLDG